MLDKENSINKVSMTSEYYKAEKMLPKVKVVHALKRLKRTQDLSHFKVTRPQTTRCNI